MDVIDEISTRKSTGTSQDLFQYQRPFHLWSKYACGCLLGLQLYESSARHSRCVEDSIQFTKPLFRPSDYLSHVLQVRDVGTENKHFGSHLLQGNNLANRVLTPAVSLAVVQYLLPLFPWRQGLPSYQY